MSTTRNNNEAQQEQPCHYHGRIVATPLPRSVLLQYDDAVNHDDNQTTPLPSNHLPTVNKAKLQQIECCSLESGTGPRKYRPTSHSDMTTSATTTTVPPLLGNPDDYPAMKLDVYLYDPHDMHIELNRNAQEVATKTLDRIALSIRKRLWKQTKKQEKKRKQQQVVQQNNHDFNNNAINKEAAAAGKKKSSPDEVQVTAYQLLDATASTTEAMNRQTILRRDCTAEAVRTSNFQFWQTRNLVIELRHNNNNNNDDDAHSLLRLLVDTCPRPKMAHVHTFGDFTANVYTGIPLHIRLDTIYAHQSRIDWYIGADKVHSTLYDASSDHNKQRQHCHTFTPPPTPLSATATTTTTTNNNNYVSVLITPIRNDDDGQGCEEAYRFAQQIQDPPRNTILDLRSQWLQTTRTANRRISSSSSSSSSSPSRNIRILTYNILAHQNAFAHKNSNTPFFPYVASDILAKERRLPLIVQELLAYQADILCLQEVDESVYEDLLEPIMTSRNYQGYYAGKDSDRTREGCAIFWSLDAFLSVEEAKDDATVPQTFTIRDLLTEKYEDKNMAGWTASMTAVTKLFEHRPDLYHIFTTHLGHIAQLVPLTLRQRQKPHQRTVIWVANTHLFYHPMGHHIRTLQMFLLARKVHSCLQQRPGELVFCGDFNASLTNNAGKLLYNRVMPRNFGRLKEHLNVYQWENSGSESSSLQPNVAHSDDFPEIRLADSFPKLQSAVDETTDSFFTHYILPVCAVNRLHPCPPSNK